MKTASDPRHQHRIEIIRNLYSFSFGPQGTKMGLIRPIIARQVELDRQIRQAAPEWPIDKINRIDLAILRLAAYEIAMGKIPVKVVIDEAVELAKEYGGEKSPQFINGALGAMLKNQSCQTQNSST